MATLPLTLESERGDTLTLAYDEATDTLTIAGAKYGAQLFREWGRDGMETDGLFRFVRTASGGISIERVPEA